MGIEIVERVWDSSEQSGSRLLALLAIALVADSGTGQAFIRIDTLAHRCKVSEAEAELIVAGLKADGDVLDVRRQNVLALGDGYFLRLGKYARIGIGNGRVLPMFPVPQRNKVADVVRQRVFERDAYRCRYCGDYHSLSVDHVIPVSLGGSNDISNLVTCCMWCNSRKGAKTPDQAGMVLLTPHSG